MSILNSTQTGLKILDDLITFDDRLDPNGNYLDSIKVTNNLTGDVRFVRSDIIFDVDNPVNNNLQKYHPLYKRIFRNTIKKLKFKIFHPIKFFNLIKLAKLSLSEADKETKTKLELLLKQVRKAKQTAYAEEIENKLLQYQRELKMLEYNIDTYIPEEIFVKYKKYDNQHLRLDYIGNFDRVIPDQLYNIIAHLTENKVFDNFLILHQSINKNKKLTKAEKRATKDPVLFGVIKESRRLYYLGDWIDDYCDLTLDMLISHFKLTKDQINLPFSLIEFNIKTLTSEGKSE